MEPTPLEEAKNSEIQRIVMDFLKRAVSSSRDFHEKTGISHAMFGRYVDQNSIMTLDKLENIVSKFPDIKNLIASHLSGNTEEKHTSVDKMDEKDKTIQSLNISVQALQALLMIEKADREKAEKERDDLKAELDKLKKKQGPADNPKK